MLNILDFIFYFFYKKYQAWGERDIPGLYSIAVITVLQVFNVFSLLILMLMVKLISIDVILNVYFVVGTLILFLVNYFYIYVFKGGRNFELFEQIIKDKKIKRKAFIYIFLSVLFFLAFLICFLVTRG